MRKPMLSPAQQRRLADIPTTWSRIPDRIHWMTNPTYYALRKLGAFEVRNITTGPNNCWWEWRRAPLETTEQTFARNLIDARNPAIL